MKHKTPKKIELIFFLKSMADLLENHASNQILRCWQAEERVPEKSIQTGLKEMPKR
jgi:hypothetical protein